MILKSYYFSSLYSNPSLNLDLQVVWSPVIALFGLSARSYNSRVYLFQIADRPSRFCLHHRGRPERLHLRHSLNLQLSRRPKRGGGESVLNRLIFPEQTGLSSQNRYPCFVRFRSLRWFLACLCQSVDRSLLVQIPETGSWCLWQTLLLYAGPPLITLSFWRL